MTIQQIKQNKAKIAGAVAVLAFIVLLFILLREPAPQEQQIIYDLILTALKLKG